MKVAIIEDEKLAQREIIELLKQVAPGVEILTCLASVLESVAWLRDQPEVDLLLMDIALSDGQSFEIFEQVSVDIPVIFLTAYDEYALRAFRVNSIDYLLKPVEESELRRALDKYQKMGKPKLTLSLEDIQAITQTERPVYKERFVVRLGDVYRHISTEEIAYFYADEKVVWLVTHKKSKYILDHTLNELESWLNTHRFFRANRKYIVSIQAVEHAAKYFNSRLKLTLSPPSDDEILISRIRVPEFLDWMAHHP